MFAEVTDTSFMRERLTALDALARSSPALALSEASHLAETLLREFGHSLDAEQLETELRQATDLDTQLLENTLDAIVDKQPKAIATPSGHVVEPQEQAERLRQLIADARASQPTTHKLSAWLTIELEADTRMMNLLACASASGIDLTPLVPTGSAKLTHLDDETLTDQWSRIQGEFDPSRILTTFAEEISKLPQDYLASGSAEALRRKISDYVLAVKPSIVASRYLRGISSYPSSALGPARLLCINSTVVPLEHDADRLDLVHTLGGLAALWRDVFGKDRRSLGALLGVSHESQLLAGTDPQDAQKKLLAIGAPERAAGAIYTLRSLLGSIERRGGPAAPLISALRRYQLSLEVLAPDSSRSIARLGELTLQKQLSSFLITQGIYTEGTKFGRLQSDLVTTAHANAAVIEVKLNRAAKPPTLASVRANLSQLQDYLESRPSRSRGVLVIYNLSSTFLQPPHRWVRGRYWITVVNLGAATGSQRKRSLLLREGVGNELLSGVTSDGDLAQ